MDSSSPRKPSPFPFWNRLDAELRETIKTLVFAVVFALVFRSFLYEPFHIPSDSMKSNLLVGDYLFVSKFSYGYSRYSLPFFGFPHVHGRFFEHPPKRGDVVVFRPPGDPSDDFIKRLIGLPGDHIQMRGGILYINDKAVPKVYVDEWTDPAKDGMSGNTVTYKRYRETLPEGKSYYILNSKFNSDVADADGFNPETTMEYVVPEGHYFMMGDNRDDSADSRYLAKGDMRVAYVPAENFVGRADLILLSWNSFLSFRPDRFFKIIP